MNYDDKGRPINVLGQPMKELPDSFSYDHDFLSRQCGFTEEELKYFNIHIENIGALTRQKLIMCGVAPNFADLFMYIYDICVGKVNGGAGLDLTGYLTISKHLNKLFKLRNMTGDPTQGANVAATMGVTKDRLPRSLYTELPRRVEIHSIPEDSKFAIFNSDNYKHYDRLYVVKPGTNMGQNITLQTDKQPKLAYREKRELEGVLRLDDMSNTGVSDLVVNRAYLHLHNVFYITAQVGDLRQMEHYGAARIVAHDGTIVTVRVEVWVPKASMTKKVDNRRVYEIGFFPDELRPKLTKVAKQLYQSNVIQGKYIEMIEPTLDFQEITEEETEEVIVE